ncbi:MAG: 30S ribosomal protein S20 [Mycobacteriaceae bacterium]
MANIKSQVKRIRTNERQRLRNQSVRSSVRTAIRHFREAVATGDRDTASASLLVASRKLDKAAGKGVIHANQAANKKSAMAIAVNQLD